jgi:membrane protease YdiL (CAAX protease family)
MAAVRARWLLVAATVVLWMGIGAVVTDDPNVYLLLGIPITLAFQVAAARRPLAELWVRGERTRRPSNAVVALLAALPALLALALAAQQHWAEAGWALAATVGGAGAAFALANLDRARLRRGAPAAATAAIIGAAVFVAFATSRLRQLGGGRLVEAPFDLLLYFVVSFALEEVTFRGAFDSYLHADETAPAPTAAAAYIAALWGLWHLPIVEDPSLATVAALVAFHTAVGIPLAIAWRRSGNLAVPAAAHALADTIRNVVR